MNEQRISLETAKLAKKAGFQVGVFGIFVEYFKTNKSDNPSFATTKGEVGYEKSYMVNGLSELGDLSNENYQCYSAPTQALLQKWLRKNTGIKVLISYADPMQSHLGIIYQATNWIYQGNKTMIIQGYLHKINGVLMHPRSVVAKYGTIVSKVLTGVDSLYERIRMENKHRYIYILHKKDRNHILNNLKHKPKPYPKLPTERG